MPRGKKQPKNKIQKPDDDMDFAPELLNDDDEEFTAGYDHSGRKDYFDESPAAGGYDYDETE